MFNAFPNIPLVGTIAPGTLALGLAIISGVTATPVEASTFSSVSGFEGPYDTTNWSLTNDNANGSVDVTDAPNSITLTGGDNQSFLFGSTSFTISAPANGTVSFDYDYNSFDLDGPAFDPFGVVVNEIFTQITNDSGPDNQTGSFSFSVDQGDIFGFAVQTDDNIFGPASVTISDFEAPAPVPESGTILGLLAVGRLGFTLKRKKDSNN